MPLAVGPQRLYVSVPEEMRDRVKSVHADEEGRFLGMVHDVRPITAIAPEPMPVQAYVTDADAAATDMVFQTFQTYQLRMTVPVVPPTGMYFMPGGPLYIEGTNYVANGSDISSGSANVIWTQWTTGTSTVNIENNVWTTWQNNTTSGTVYPQRYAQTYTPPAPLTAEQIAEQEARYAKIERKRKREVRQRQIAELRAQRLLHELLTDEQAKEYAERKSFHVRVRDRTFRINRGLAGNITEIDEAGNQLAKYCVHLYGQEPTEDSMVAQLLMLQTDLAEFERRANVTRYRPRVSAAA